MELRSGPLILCDTSVCVCVCVCEYKGRIEITTARVLFLIPGVSEKENRF